MSQFPQPLPACRLHPLWGCGQQLGLSCRACEAGVAAGSVSVCTWPSPSPCRYGHCWAKLGGPAVCPGASGSLALRAGARVASPASVIFSHVSGWAGRPPESFLPWQEYTSNARSCWGSRQTLEQLLQPIVLGHRWGTRGPLAQPTQAPPVPAIPHQIPWVIWNSVSTLSVENGRALVGTGVPGAVPGLGLHF